MHHCRILVYLYYSKHNYDSRYRGHAFAGPLVALEVYKYVHTYDFERNKHVGISMVQSPINLMSTA